MPMLKHTLAQEWLNELHDVRTNLSQYKFPEFLKEVLKNKITYAEDTLKVFKILYKEYLYQEELRNNLYNLIPRGICCRN